MALVDPSIAMSYRAPEFKAPNQLAQYAQMQQILGGQQEQQLNALKMKEYERARTEQEGLRNYLAQADLANPQTRIGAMRFGETGLKYGKALSEQEKDVAATAASKFELKAKQAAFLDQAKRNLSSNPSDDNVRSWGQDAVINGIYTPEQAELTVQELLKIPPENRAKILAMSGATPKELAPTFKEQNLGSTTQIVSIPAFGGQATVVPGSVGQKTVTPGEALSSETARLGQTSVANTAANRLKFDQTKFNWEKANPGYSLQDSSAGLVAVNLKNPTDVRQISVDGQIVGPKPVYNAQAGGFVAPPVAGGKPGFTPIPEVQQLKDQQAAVKALRSAGYDPETGNDTISKLIEKSTSGRLQAGTAASLAFLGVTTEGRKAIAALEGTANQIATDLAGGKLGAGISNADRDFIVAALGDVANANKTSEERLAGWTAAKNRMISAGLVPPPKTGAPGKPAAPGKTESGATTSNW